MGQQFAANGYFRIEAPGEVECVLVASKGPPTKPVTIPRLELQAAVLGVRLANEWRLEWRWVCSIKRKHCRR